MKRIAVTLTTNLWVPEGRYTDGNMLNMLAAHLRDKLTEPLADWAKQPDAAVTDTLVIVEVKE